MHTVWAEVENMHHKICKLKLTTNIKMLIINKYIVCLVSEWVNDTAITGNWHSISLYFTEGDQFVVWQSRDHSPGALERPTEEDLVFTVVLAITVPETNQMHDHWIKPSEYTNGKSSSCPGRVRLVFARNNPLAARQGTPVTFGLHFRFEPTSLWLKLL